MRLLSRFAIGTLVGFSVSCLIALASYSLGLWLGRNSANLFSLIYGSIPLALLLGVAAVVQPRHGAGQQARPIPAVFIGAALGFLYTLVFARFSFVFPAFVVLMISCWVPSGISAMVAATGGKRLSTVAGIAILCIAVVLLTEPLFNAFAHAQQLTVAFVTPAEPSTAQLEVNPESLGFNNDDELQIAKNEVLQHVRALGDAETFRVLSITRWGKGSKSLAILVVRAPITREVTLPEPDRATVVYIQQSENWDKKPSEVSLLRRGITMEPPDAAGDSRDYKSFGYFRIPDAQGVSLVGRIISRAPIQSH